MGGDLGLRSIDAGGDCSDFWQRWTSPVTGVLGAVVGAVVVYGLSSGRPTETHELSLGNLHIDVAVTDGGAMGLLSARY